MIPTAILLMTLLQPTTGPVTRATAPLGTRWLGAATTSPVAGATSRPASRQAAAPTVQPSLPFAPPWPDARIDAAALANQFECFDFAYTRQTVREPDGTSTQRDVLLFQVRAVRNATVSVLQARMLDESGAELDRSVVRFKPIVLHWTKDQVALASCWIEPTVMPRVRRIELSPL